MSADHQPDCLNCAESRQAVIDAMSLSNDLCEVREKEIDRLKALNAELLDAIKALYNFGEWTCEGTLTTDQVRIWDAAKAAIAKAEGRE